MAKAPRSPGLKRPANAAFHRTAELRARARQEEAVARVRLGQDVSEAQPLDLPRFLCGGARKLQGISRIDVAT
jgi:hypothetical protein